MGCLADTTVFLLENRQGKQMVALIKRWYDQEPTMALIVQQLQRLAPEGQDVVATLIGRLAKNVIDKRPNKQLVSKDKMLGLMRARQKRRWYDRSSSLYNAFNDLYLLETQEQRMLCTSLRRLLSLLSQLENTFQQRYRQYPSAQQYYDVLDTWVREGEQAAMACVQAQVVAVHS